MPKQSSPRTFTSLARRGNKGAAGANSGIFSGGSSGRQKLDPPSRSSPLNEPNEDGDRGALKYAVTVPQKKSGSTSNGLTDPNALRRYAVDHGEK